MLRRAVFATLAIISASLPAASLAYDIKPKDSASAFTAKMRPEYSGHLHRFHGRSRSRDFSRDFQGAARHQADIEQQKFGNTAVSYIAALTSNFPSGAKQTGEMLSTSFTSPASANRAFFIARSLTFAPDQQPSRTEMIKQVMDKYGAPTIVGDQHLYYVYRAGKIVSVGVKYKEPTALEALDRPLDPKAAIKLDGDNGRGSCVAAVKRSLAKDKTLAAMLDEAKAANCDGTLSVQLAPGAPADRIGTAQFTLLDFKRMVSAAKIDGDALAAESKERNPTPQGTAPKL